MSLRLLKRSRSRRSSEQGLFDSPLPSEESLDLIYREVIDSLPPDYYRRGAVNLAKVLIWAKKYSEAFLFLDRLWEILAAHRMPLPSINPP